MADTRTNTQGTWIALDSEARIAWLERARDRHFARGASAAQRSAPDRVITLDVATIDDLPSFLCALGEAVNGPGGYFGLNLGALEDCLIGGFGANPPWTLHVTSEAHLQRVLGSHALLEWARAGLRHRTYLDDEGRDWLNGTLRRAERRETLWTDIRALFLHCGVTVVDDATA